MLSVDLVQARRQKDRLLVTPLGERTERALEIAEGVATMVQVGGMIGMAPQRRARFRQ